MWCSQGMIEVVKRTGHSSYYVEKGMAAMGKTPEQMGIKTDHLCGGGGYLLSGTEKATLTSFSISPSVSNMAGGMCQPRVFPTRKLHGIPLERSLLPYSGRSLLLWVQR